MPAPCTVTLLDPVTIALPALAVLSHMMSTDSPADMLPTLLPTLIDSSMLPPLPNPIAHCAAVSDVHSVRSHTLRPVLHDTEYPASPILAPYTVTTPNPLAPEFALRAVLNNNLPPENISLTLPTRLPALINASRLFVVPDPASHLTDVSDSHTVRSGVERPSLPAVVAPVSPSPAPHITIFVDPVASAFDIPITLAFSLSVDTTTLALPTRPAVLKATRRLSASPDTAWHRKDVSDSHAVCSHLLKPNRLDPL
jgi:hypothetical protein